MDIIAEHAKKVRQEVRERTASYLIAAFGLVVGLAWNEAIKSLIDAFFPISHNGVLAKFIYAAVLTYVLVVVSISLTRGASPAEVSGAGDKKDS